MLVLPVVMLTSFFGQIFYLYFGVLNVSDILKSLFNGSLSVVTSLGVCLGSIPLNFQSENIFLFSLNYCKYHALKLIQLLATILMENKDRKCCAINILQY